MGDRPSVFVERNQRTIHIRKCILQHLQLLRITEFREKHLDRSHMS